MTIFKKILYSVLFSYMFFTAFYAYKAFEFRKHPNPSLSYKFSNSNYPHNIISKLIIYFSGSEAYNSYIFELSNNHRFIRNSSFDCYLTQRIEKSLNITIIENFLSEQDDFSYCVSKAILKDRRLEYENPYWLYSLFNSLTNSGSHKLVEYLVNKELIDKHDYDLFKFIYAMLSRDKKINMNMLMTRYYDEINDDLLKEKKEKDASDKISTILAGFSTINSQDGIEKILDNNKNLTKQQRYYFACSLYGKGNLKQQEKSLKIIKSLGLRNIESFYFEEVDNIANIDKRNIIKKINLAKNIDQYFASILFHYSLFLIESDISHNVNIISKKNTNLDFGKVKEMATIKTYESAYYKELKKFILENVKLKDSEFKKNLIVLLIRHDHPLGSEFIDEAFKNKSVRSIMFTSIRQYIYGSSATGYYEKISEHKYTSYRESAWPLPPYSMTNEKSLSTKVSLWRDFVLKYPWHPGADDAYFRLAYDQANLKDYKSSIKTVTEYFQMKNMADKSASIYMRVLLVYLLEKNSVSMFKKIKQIYDIPYCITDNKCELPDPSIVKEIINNDLYMDAVFLNKSQLLVLRVFLEKAKKTNNFTKLVSKNINFRKIIRDIVYVKQIHEIYDDADYNNSSYIDVMKSEYDFNYNISKNTLSERTSTMVDGISKLLANNKWMIIKERSFY